MCAIAHTFWEKCPHPREHISRVLTLRCTLVCWMAIMTFGCIHICPCTYFDRMASSFAHGFRDDMMVLAHGFSYFMFVSRERATLHAHLLRTLHLFCTHSYNALPTFPIMGMQLVDIDDGSLVSMESSLFHGILAHL
jgi:hypothetical protein